MRLIDADALIAQMEADAEQMEEPIAQMFAYAAISDIKHAPTIEPERKNCDTCQYNNLDWDEEPCDGCTGDRYKPEQKKDTIQKFHDYQIDWLNSHYDIELEPQLEELIVQFLHDTANCYMMEEGDNA